MENCHNNVSSLYMLQIKNIDNCFWKRLVQCMTICSCIVVSEWQVCPVTEWLKLFLKGKKSETRGSMMH